MQSNELGISITNLLQTMNISFVSMGKKIQRKNDVFKVPKQKQGVICNPHKWTTKLFHLSLILTK